MPTLDIAMPIALFIVITVALFLNKRVENKLVATVEKREFKTRDIALFAVFIVIMVSVIAYTSTVNPDSIVPNVLLVLFLASYTMLLFTFSYVFTNLTRVRAQIISTAFGVSALIAGISSFAAPFTDEFTIYRAIAFFILSGLCFVAVAFEQKYSISKQRWYLAAQPPALFVLLFIFFAAIYNGTFNVWFPILLDVFAFTFAILIILYLSSLFTWKTTWMFAAVLPIIDIFLVFTGPMVTAARTFTGLGLPVLVYLPNLPLILTETGAIGLRGLGLGDYFFAGILVTQTYKKFDMRTGLIAAAAIAVSFGIWEAFLPEITSYFGIGGFPATVCIITGWLPVALWKVFSTRNQIKSPAPQPTAEPSLPATPQ